jgi:hypothetical protein
MKFRGKNLLYETAANNLTNDLLIHEKSFFLTLFLKFLAAAFCSERNSESLLLFWFHETEFRVGLSSAEGVGTELCKFAYFFVPRNGIPIFILFCGRVRNGIPRVFCSKGNNWNFVGITIFPSIPSSAELFFCRKIPNPIWEIMLVLYSILFQ